MNGRLLIQAVAASALALGATAALSGCGSSTASTASGEATQSVTTQSPTSAGTTVTSAAVTASASAANDATVSTAASATASGNGESAQNSGAGSNACATGKVSVKLGAEDAGATHRGMVLLFTNTGSSTCTLTGYPGATITNSGMDNFSPYINAQRTLTGYEGGATAVTTVSLSPGGSVSALLEWDADTNPSGQTPNAANCAGMDGGYLEITPPNTTVYTRFDPPTDMCTDLVIHPVVTGASGRSAG
jgi:hypothetical protein